MTAERDRDRITLTLEGQRARAGVSLAAFDVFVTHLLAALRYHYRSATAATVKKTGRPFGKDDLATSFRLTEFRVGSGIAVLEPPLPDDGSALALAEVPSLAWENVADFLEAVATGRQLDDAVIGELETARRALGPDGRYGVELAGGGRVRSERFDRCRIESMPRAAQPASVAPHAIVGVLHAIDLEPDKVGIRTASGVDWSCRYPSELETAVLQLIGSRVWARGTGQALSPRTGALELVEIHRAAEYEQTSLFTAEPIPFDQLMESQGISTPQGLTALADPDWSEGEESDRFLEATLADAG